MRQWEYAVIRLETANVLERATMLDEMGWIGFELVNVDGEDSNEFPVAYFKREIEPASKMRAG